MAIKLVEAQGDEINIRIIQGSDWLITVNYGTTDLSGASVAAMIRNKFSDVSPYATFTATITSTGSGTSSFTLELSNAQTAALAVPADAPDPDARDVLVGQWDWEVTDSGGTVSRPIRRGNARLNQEATK